MNGNLKSQLCVIVNSVSADEAAVVPVVVVVVVVAGNNDGDVAPLAGSNNK